ncbi:MAG: GntP family permease, partial [Paracoccus sp. (in: a-proteobacteria)]|nr:GntP family permease [Paracoccus sp. (in: a-proteobacteria)]
FAVYPIASALFRRADIPKRLLPATIALGAFTFTMSAFPGTPAIQNAIPMPFFGTNVFAAPLLGLFAGAIMLVGGTMWLERRAAGARLSGEGYGTHPATAADSAPREDDALPPFGLAVLPVVAVIVLNALLTWVVFPRMQTDYLSLPLYGSTDLQSVAGLWAIILSLILSTLLAVALNWKRFADLRKSLNAGTIGSLEPIMNTASVVGYGAVIAALPAFLVLRDSVLDLFPGNAQASLAVAVMTLSGITGSASGGMSIALQALGTEFAQMAQAQGISMEVMHRITALAGGSFDVLPHNGAVITLLAITGMTHRKAYGDIFVVGIVIPVIALLLALLVSTLF